LIVKARLGVIMIKKVLVGVVVAGIAAMAIHEFPALRREIRIWRM
jgi:hypothetical protein